MRIHLEAKTSGIACAWTMAMGAPIAGRSSDASGQRQGVNVLTETRDRQTA